MFAYQSYLLTIIKMITTKTIRLIAAYCLLLSSGVLSQTIPEDRIVDWSQAGLLYDIPNSSALFSVIDFGATGDGLTDDSPAVQDALNAMENNAGILFFPSGTYLLTESIIAHSGLTIRGESSEETHLKFFLGSDSENAIQVSASQSSSFYQVVAGFEMGSQNITICSTNNFHAGDFIELQQTNGDWDIEPISWAENSVGQILQVSYINENDLNLENKLRISYHETLNPEVRIIQPIQNVKIENLKLERLDAPDSGGGKNIYFSYAINCQVSGVDSYKSQGSHIYATTSSNIYIFGNYIHDAFLYDGTATRGYGITLNKHTGEVLVENNIFQNLRHAMMVKTGANGNVFTYNYSREPHRSEPISNYSGDISIHGHYPYANLFEENICQNIFIDHYWGPGGPYNTFFRNRTELYGFIMTSNNILETQNQNITGNEIANNFPYGFYVTTGSEHFEYGNNDGGSAIPSNTNDYEDISYFYPQRPWFLESSLPFPAIGFPHTLNQWSNPAKQRFVEGGIQTVQIDFSTVGIDDIRNNNLPEINVMILNNPVSKFLLLRVLDNVSLNYSIFNITGKLMIHDKLKQNDNTAQIFVSQLETGIYLIEFSSSSDRTVLKFYKE